MRALCLVVVAGCFAPSYPEQLRCGTGTEQCPPGQLCGPDDRCHGAADAAGGDATDAPLDGPPDDRDADGIQNEVDDCPDRFDPMQYDEDTDGLGDVCDPCPPFAENADLDGDGVGGECDPNPMTVGDALVLFEGFNEVPVSWRSLGTWTAASGAVLTNVGNDELAMLLAPTIVDRVGTASAAFVATAIVSGARGIGLGFPVSLDEMVGVACVNFLEPGTNAQRTGLIDNATALQIATKPLAWVVDTTYMVVLSRTHPVYNCTTRAPGLPDTVSTANHSDEPAEPHIAVATRAVSGKFLWLMYVDSP